MVIKMIVSDIAGTTIVDTDYVAIAFIEAFLNEGIDLKVEEIQPLMGFKKTQAISTVLELKGVNVDPILINRIHDNFQMNMIKFYSTSLVVEPLPGVEDFFQQCKEKDVVVTLNSGFPKIIVDVILDRMGWLESGLVSSVIASDEVENGRPSEEMIEVLMKRHGISDSAEILKVGDTMVDIQEGRNAKCGIVVGVTTGAYKREELLKFEPDFIIDHFGELSKLIWH
jgi:phosphonatase-like hydrolase